MGIARASNGSASVYTQHYLFSRLARPLQNDGASTPKPTLKPTLKPTVKPTPPPAYKTLKNGSSGSAVKKLEQRLNKLGYLSSKYVNTRYDSKTVTAVKNFQNL